MDRCDISTTLNLLNNYHPKIVFTEKIENNGTLPFLDTLIKSNFSIITDIYIKPSKSDRMLRYNAHHPIDQKRSLLYVEMVRINRISNECNLKEFSSRCLRHGYPKQLVEEMQRRYHVSRFKRK